MQTSHPVGLPVRYRILAAEAHSWSSLLIESDAGRRFLLAVAPGTLSAISEETVERLLASRAYRPWRGDRSWQPLERLPVFQRATGRSDQSAVSDPADLPGTGSSDELAPS